MHRDSSRPSSFCAMDSTATFREHVTLLNELLSHFAARPRLANLKQLG